MERKVVGLLRLSGITLPDHFLFISILRKFEKESLGGAIRGLQENRCSGSSFR